MHTICHVEHLLYLAFLTLHDGVVQQSEAVLINHLEQIQLQLPEVLFKQIEFAAIKFSQY